MSLLNRITAGGVSWHTGCAEYVAATPKAKRAPCGLPPCLGTHPRGVRVHSHRREPRVFTVALFITTKPETTQMPTNRRANGEISYGTSSFIRNARCNCPSACKDQRSPVRVPARKGMTIPRKSQGHTHPAREDLGGHKTHVAMPWLDQGDPVPQGRTPLPYPCLAPLPDYLWAGVPALCFLQGLEGGGGHYTWLWFFLSCCLFFDS